MPQYDLAGNPLPEPPSSGTAAPRTDFAGNPLPAAPLPAQNTAPPQNAPAPVRYDLAGNVIPASSPVASTPFANPNAPPPNSPYGSPAGVWPPPPTGAYTRPEFVNTSGEAGPPPPEIAQLKWNWGAFLFPAYWCRQHGLGIIAVLLIVLLIGPRLLLRGSPIAGSVVLLAFGIYWCARIYFGFAGHRMAWRYRRFPGGVSEHLDVQKSLMLCAFLLFFIFEGLGLVLVVIGASTHAGASPGTIR